MENELPPEFRPEPQLNGPQQAEAQQPEIKPEVYAEAPPAPVATAPPTPDVPAYRDRRTGLIIFGVVQIVLGLLAALMVPLAALGAFLSRLAPGGAMRPGQFVSGVATYAFIAAAFLALGIGSVQTKRWARALTLVTSWYWLIVGAMVTVLITAVLPATMRGALVQAQQSGSNAPSADVTTGVMAVIITLAIVFATAFLVMLPIAFVVFYGRKDVELTCHHRDPVPRWTDRAPLPVLGGSLVFLFGSLYNLLLSVTTPMFPFFGHYLTGIPGAACLFVFAVLDLYVATSLFRLRSSGWWVAIITTPLRMLAVVFSYSQDGLMQAYSKLGWSEQQLNMLRSSPFFRSRLIFWWSGLMMFILFGYLLWLRRYFKSPAAPQPAEAVPVQVA